MQQQTNVHATLLFVDCVWTALNSKSLSDLWPQTSPVLQAKHSHALHAKLLTQDIGGPVPGDEARIVPIAHPFLQDASPEVFAEAAARCHQTVVATVRLRKSADDSSGN